MDNACIFKPNVLLKLSSLVVKTLTSLSRNVHLTPFHVLLYQPVCMLLFNLLIKVVSSARTSAQPRNVKSRSLIHSLGTESDTPPLSKDL